MSNNGKPAHQRDHWTDLPFGPADLDRELMQVRSASPWAVDIVTGASSNTGEGRSNWFWLRLPNGDLALACYPQGDTYERVESDFGRH